MAAGQLRGCKIVCVRIRLFWDGIAALRAWIFVTAVSAAAQAFAQAPVEERQPAKDDTGTVQRRIDFARQALERAEAQLRDAETEHDEAKLRFDAARERFDETARNLDRARAESTRARKDYEAQSSELERRRGGKGG